MAPLVWLVTGCTGGLGYAFIESIAARGDMVVATGRNAEKRIAHLKSDNVAVLDLDLLASRSEIDRQIKKAVDIFGRLDVLVNNAGNAGAKFVEEADDAFVQRIFDLNVHGTMRVTQSVLPYFRAQKSGKIAFMGSCVAWGPFPIFTHYAAAKAALDVLAEGLQKEVAPLGIKVVSFACGTFQSDLGAPRSGDEGFQPPVLADYRPLWDSFMATFSSAFQFNDKRKFGDLLVRLIHYEGEAAGRPWPFRICVGPDALAAVEQRCRETLRLAGEWADAARSVLPDGVSAEDGAEARAKTLVVSALPMVA